MRFLDSDFNDNFYLEIKNSGSYIFNDNELIVKEGINIRAFTYTGWKSNSFEEREPLGSLPDTPEAYKYMELLRCYKGALYLCSPLKNGGNSHYVTIFDRKPTANFIVHEKTEAWNGGLINRTILRKTDVIVNEKHIIMIHSGKTQMLERIEQTHTKKD